MSRIRILVTGGAGFLGSHLGERLISDGNEVLCVDELAASLYRDAFIQSNLNRVIHREFDRGAHLLHAGCGSGRVDVDLHGYLDVTAVDISVAALKRYSSENPVVSELRHADILDLPFPEDSFDGTYNLGVVEHFADGELDRLFRELARVTKPDGKVVVFWPQQKRAGGRTHQEPTRNPGKAMRPLTTR